MLDIHGRQTVPQMETLEKAPLVGRATNMVAQMRLFGRRWDKVVVAVEVEGMNNCRTDLLPLWTILRT